MPRSVLRRLAVSSAIGLMAINAMAVTPAALAKPSSGGGIAAVPGCNLGSNGAKRVVVLDFDNVHLLRDNPNVPSDLEQMPHLLNFIRDNGTMLSKSYTILISHTAGGILSTLTGLYPDRQGVTVSNSYDYYRPDNTPTFSSAFKYWTAPVAAAPNDALPNLITDGQKNTPAPWVTYTRAGCDVANFSVANTVLENNSTLPGGDIYNVYGPSSPEAAEPAPQRTTDFVGIAIHCAQTTASKCNANTDAKDDVLPDEPGGYTGYKALFGAKYVNKALTGSGCVNDINGNQILGSPTSTGCGFPGFDGMSAANSLGYVAQSVESGVPVTYAYISDVHDNHAGGGAYGPGEAGYVAALKSYDDAFAGFFSRLTADGYNKSNTLFVVTADENDHYAGQQAQGCDGVTTPCVYNTAPGMAVGGKPQHGMFDVTNLGATPFTVPSWPPAGVNGPLVGEVGYNIKWNGLIGPTVNGTGYDISFDSAPSFYINGQPQAIDGSGNLAVNPTLRAFEQAASNLNAFDPYVDSSQLVPVANYLVDYPTLKAIHMINTDPRRNMSFTMFSKPDFYFQTSSPCNNPLPNPPTGSQGCVNDSFAWIHGDYSEDIGRTWLGMAGPGIANNGQDNNTWTDHTDVVPTLNAILGLTPDYRPDGRVITQLLTPSVAKGGNGKSFQDLGDSLKQLDAPYGAFNHSLIVASTRAIKSDDTTYLSVEQQIQNLATQRDTLADQIREVLDGTSNGHREQLIHAANDLISQAAVLANP